MSNSGSTPCQSGSYLDNHGLCSKCVWSWMSERIGCGPYCFCVDNNATGVLIGSMAALYLASVTIAGSDAYNIVLITLIPCLDFLFGILYVMQSSFFHLVIGVILCIFLAVPSASFILVLYHLDAMKPEWGLIQRLPFHLYLEVFMWLGYENGLPTAYSRPISVVFRDYDALDKLIFNLLVWILLLSLQMLSLILFGIIVAVPIILQILFLVAWLLLGIVLDQMKVFCVCKIWNLWFLVWTGSHKHDMPHRFNYNILRDSLFYGFILGAAPQLILRLINNLLTDQWTPISITSIVFSAYYILSNVYQLAYSLLNHLMGTHTETAQPQLNNDTSTASIAVFEDTRPSVMTDTESNLQIPSPKTISVCEFHDIVIGDPSMKMMTESPYSTSSSGYLDPTLLHDSLSYPPEYNAAATDKLVDLARLPVVEDKDRELPGDGVPDYSYFTNHLDCDVDSNADSKCGDDEESVIVTADADPGDSRVVVLQMMRELEQRRMAQAIGTTSERPHSGV